MADLQVILFIQVMIIHTSYDIKIIINKRFCPVPENLHVVSVQTRNEINEGEE